MPPSIDTQEDCDAWMRTGRMCGFDLYFGRGEASSIARRIWRGRQVSQLKSGMCCRICRLENYKNQSARSKVYGSIVSRVKYDLKK